MFRKGDGLKIKGIDPVQANRYWCEIIEKNVKPHPFRAFNTPRPNEISRDRLCGRQQTSYAHGYGSDSAEYASRLRRSRTLPPAGKKIELIIP